MRSAIAITTYAVIGLVLAFTVSVGYSLAWLIFWHSIFLFTVFDVSVVRIDNWILGRNLAYTSRHNFSELSGFGGVVLRMGLAYPLFMYIGLLVFFIIRGGYF